jgi:hypothetical protein
MFEQAFRNIDDVLRKEAGCTTELTTRSRLHGCCFCNIWTDWSRTRLRRPDTIEYKIGEIFGEIKNKITSGYNL